MVPVRCSITSILGKITRSISGLIPKIEEPYDHFQALKETKQYPGEPVNDCDGWMRIIMSKMQPVTVISPMLAMKYFVQGLIPQLREKVLLHPMNNYEQE